MAEPQDHDPTRPAKAPDPAASPSPSEAAPVQPPHPPDPEQSEQEEADPAVQLQEALAEDRGEQLERMIRGLPAGELARALSRLNADQQAHLLNIVPVQTAGFLFERISHPQAAEIIDDLSDSRAAMILDELPSDERADVLGQMERTAAAAVIEKMAPEEARDARLLTRYPPHTAGGVMITEYLAFFESMTVDDVLHDIRANAAQYHTYDVQYVYVIGSAGELRGVVRLRDLVIRPRGTKIREVMIDRPRFVRDDATLDDLERFFDANHFFAVPVVDAQDHLLGLARREAVEEALSERSERSLMRFGGIIAGEENRQMPVVSRATRRLAFLLPNILLNMVSVGVIALFEPTIAQVTALAIFLPLISDMGGNAGIQAIAVSMRELSLGLLRPAEARRVVAKELSVGVVGGIVVGVIVAGIAYGLRPEYGFVLGVVVGAAMLLNNIVAVIAGGVLPLLLQRVKIDPALASGPILTTVTDFSGFFLALLFTAFALKMHWLTIAQPTTAAAMAGALHAFG